MFSSKKGWEFADASECLSFHGLNSSSFTGLYSLEIYTGHYDFSQAFLKSKKYPITHPNFAPHPPGPRWSQLSLLSRKWQPGRNFYSNLRIEKKEPN